MQVATGAVRWPLGGVAAWLTLVVLRTAGIVELGLRGLVILSAVLVAVPLALPLLGRTKAPVPAHALGAGAAIAAYLTPVGPWSAALAVGWLVASAWLTAPVALAWVKRPCLEPDALACLAASGWLPAGAVWLVAHRGGWSLAGFHEPIVELTVAHFHVAGFVAATVLATAHGRLAGGPGTGRRRLANLALFGVCVAPFVVAIGHLAGPVVELAGTTLTVSGFASYAALVLTSRTSNLAAVRVGALAPVRVGALATVRVGALAPFVPLVFAVAYALAPVFGTPAWSIDTMVRYHGLVNAVGFGLVSLFGWRRATIAGLTGPQTAELSARAARAPLSDVHRARRPVASHTPGA